MGGQQHGESCYTPWPIPFLTRPSLLATQVQIVPSDQTPQGRNSRTSSGRPILKRPEAEIDEATVPLVLGAGEKKKSGGARGRGQLGAVMRWGQAKFSPAAVAQGLMDTQESPATLCTHRGNSPRQLKESEALSQATHGAASQCCCCCRKA